MKVSIQHWAGPQLEESQSGSLGREPGHILGMGQDHRNGAGLLEWCRTFGMVQDQVVQQESWAGHRGDTSASSAAQRFKDAQLFISPSCLAASPEAAAVKHLSSARGSCREQSLQGTAVREKSFGGVGENETKARS